MMALYYVKRDLYGVKAGTVERFAGHKAASFLMDGSIEPYDEKRHAKAPGAPPPEPKETARSK
jgi:hypothetical protein